MSFAQLCLLLCSFLTLCSFTACHTGAIGPAALQQHRRSSAQDSSDANTLVHPKSKHKKEGCNPASGNREATERSSTSSNVSGQAAAAAAVAAGAAKGQQASNASHRSSSSKGSSSPLQVGSLQRGGSPTPSEPEQREAAGEAREEPVREDLMGAWLDQQVRLWQRDMHVRCTERVFSLALISLSGGGSGDQWGWLGGQCIA
eukprot:1157548-Pelagomonas_calceolata.AAC.2